MLPPTVVGSLDWRAIASSHTPTYHQTLLESSGGEFLNDGMLLIATTGYTIGVALRASTISYSQLAIRDKIL
jgi:hypothetical protein